MYVLAEPARTADQRVHSTNMRIQLYDASVQACQWESLGYNYANLRAHTFLARQAVFADYFPGQGPAAFANITMQSGYCSVSIF